MYSILIVDDEKLTRDGLEQYINWNSIGIDDVCTASDGQQALEIARKRSFDILMTDIMMPHMDGVELIRRYRQIDPRVRVILFSGHADADHLKKAINLKTDAYIDKPITLKNVSAVIKDVVWQIDFERNNRREAGEDDNAAGGNSSAYTDDSLELIREILPDFGNYDSRVEQGLSFIAKQFYDSGLCVATVANHLGISPNYYSTIFKKETGMTIGEYITEIRLANASYLLRTTNLKLYEISSAIGISDSNYLSILFKKRYGVSPLSYRRTKNHAISSE